MGKYKLGNKPKSEAHWEYKVEFVNDGKEYYIDPDGRLVYKIADDTLGYRVDELIPELITLLDRARNEKHNYPTREMIDNLIRIQKKEPLKACNYVKYRLLGELRYVDVFGNAAEERYAAQRHYSETAEMKKAIEDLTMQIEEMQQLIFNIAVQLNSSKYSFLKRVG